ncbi:hypothetical protein [Clostridium sp. LP20]|uniref:hypothetical protein n=1 Tax=Clostridium sp. LP20 TaxID=3418665 RepID=UPI003EE4A307
MMKKIKKALAILLAYALLISVAPIELVGKIASAKEGVPQFLEYSEINLSSLSQYKDKTLAIVEDSVDSSIGTIWEFRLSLFENGKEKVIANYGNNYCEVIDSDDGKAIIIEMIDMEYNSQNNYYEYDFITGELKSIEKPEFNNNTSDEVKNKIAAIINKKYDTNYKKDDLRMVEYLNNSVDILGNKYKSGYVGVSFEGKTFNYFIVLGDKVGYATENLSSDINTRYIPYGNSLYIIKQQVDGLVISKYENDQEVSSGKYIGAIGSMDRPIVYQGDIYININNEFAKLNLKDGEYKPEEIFKVKQNSNSIDVDRKLWIIEEDKEKSYVSMVDGGKLIRKYEINPEMTTLNVYDENNIVVTDGAWRNQKVTFINNGKSEGNNGSNPGDNNGGNTEGSDTDNKVEVEVPTVKPDEDNLVKVEADKNSSNTNVVINDIESVKGGKGSITLALKDDSKIKIPFSAIDIKLLENAKNVEVKMSAKENSEITKGLKAVNKVFSFDLVVNKNDGSEVKIHNFANGVAEISLNLTDDELAGLNRDKLLVFYYNEETKKYEAMETKVDGNVVTFKTPHFSSFIIAEAEGNVPVNNNPISKTNDNNNLVMLSIVALLSGIAVISLKKTRKTI